LSSFINKEPYRPGRVKAVIFDLDGTLLDTLADIGNAVNRILSNKGYPTHPVDRYRFFVGDGWEMLVKRALPESALTRDMVRVCVQESMVEYGKTWNATTTPYDGIPELLNHLTHEGIQLAVLSNKPHVFAQQYVDKLLATWTFENVIGVSDRFPKKPDPAGALSIMNDLNLDKGDCLFMGDTGVDMQTAAAAGIFSVGAAWGFRPEAELMENGCQFLARHPLDVLSLIPRR
jgi:phosphoglycolate phosphatase